MENNIKFRVFMTSFPAGHSYHCFVNPKFLLPQIYAGTGGILKGDPGNLGSMCSFYHSRGLFNCLNSPQHSYFLHNGDVFSVLTQPGML